MLEMRPNCEHCGRDLPANEPGAFICSFECTYCDDCTDGPLDGVCPNCRGDLEPRPLRRGAMLEKFPAGTKRVVKSSG
jgi:uncharacterized protein